MGLKERSYSTKNLRPKPLVHESEDGAFLVVATSWGEPEHAAKVIEEVVKYVEAAQSDVEVTSPFEFLTCLTDEVNHLRIAIQIANDLLYRGENRNEYFSGVEILAILKKGSQLAWAQVGNPSLLIQRKNQTLQPLSIGFDYSVDFSSPNNRLAPLPVSLIGLDPTVNIQCGDTRIEKGDHLVFFAGSAIAPVVWTEEAQIEFEVLAKRLIQSSPEVPFWLGVLQIAS